MAGDGIQHLMEIDRTAFFPGFQSPITDGKPGVRNDHLGVDHHFDSQPITLCACSLWVVERKQARFQFRVTDVAITAGEFFAEQQLLLFIFKNGNDQRTFSVVERGFYRVGQSLAHIFLDNQPVHHYFQSVLEFFVEHDFFIKGADLTVYASADESLALHIQNFSFEFSLLIPGYRGKDHHLLANGDRLDLINDMLYGLRGNLPSTTVTENLADASVEQAQVVINFCYCANGGTGISAGSLLLN